MKGVLIDGGDDITVKTYYYYNWGDRGKNNAYFCDGVFDTEKGVDTPPPERIMVIIYITSMLINKCL